MILFTSVTTDFKVKLEQDKFKNITLPDVAYKVNKDILNLKFYAINTSV